MMGVRCSTVLLIDAAAERRSFCRRCLCDNPAFASTVVEATTGMEGLHYCQESLPDLIILDTHLPDLSDTAFLTRFKQQVGQHWVPVIALVGAADDAIATQLIQHGVEDYLLTDSLTADRLCRTIGHTLQRVQLQQQQAQFQHRLQALEAELSTMAATVETHTQALQESEQKFRHLFHSTVHFMGLFQPDGVVLNINEPTLAFGQLQPAMVIGKVLWSLPWFEGLVESQALFQSGFAKAAKGELVRLEIQAKRWDGTVLDFDVSLKPLVDDTGQVYQILGEAFDISDRKLAEGDCKRVEAALFQSEAQNQAILATIPDIIATMSADGVYLSFTANNYPGNLIASGATVVGRSLVDLVPPAIAAQELHAIRQAITTGNLQIYEQQLQVNNHLQYEEVRVLPCGDGTALVMVRDVTDRKQAEIALKERETLFRAIYEQAAVGIAQAAITGHYIRSNQRFCDFLGYPATALLGKPFHDFSHPDDLAIDLDFVEQLVTGEIDSFSMEKRFIHRDGRIVWGNLTVSPLRDETGGIQYLLGVVEDISERKRLEVDRTLAEAALRENEAKQRALLSALPDLIMVINRDGIYMDFIATSAFKVIGQTGDFIGTHVSESLSPDLAARRLAAIEAAITTGTIQIYEQEIEVDGVIQTEEIRVVAYGTQEALLIARDISDRKRHETERTESEERLRRSQNALAEAQRIAHIGNWEFDVSTQKITWSEELFRIYGLDPNRPEPAFAEHVQIIHPDDRDKFQRTVQHTLLTGKPYLIEFKALRSDGAICIVEGRGEAIRNEAGQVVRLLGTAMDITQRKQAELALQSLVEGTASVTGKDFFPVLAEQIAIALDVAHVLISKWVGEQIETLATYADRPFEPKAASTIAHTPYALALHNGWYHCQSGLQGQFPNAPDLAALAADSYLGIALRSSSGKVIGLLSVLDRKPIHAIERADSLLQIFASRATAELERQQATEALLQLNHELELKVAQRTAELQKSEAALRQANSDLESRVTQRTAELQHAKEAAEAASRSKTIFLANMSHELRTPLNAILGFSQLLTRHPDLPPAQQEQIAIINRSGEHLLRLINDILEMSKIEAGRITSNATNFNLYDFLNDLKQMFQLRVERKGLRLICDYSVSLPQFVQTDEGKLRQVLINLMGNAVKFTADGWVKLRVSSAQSDATAANAQGLTLRFEVTDTGMGIPTDELESLFEPFVQSSNPTANQEGTGLGLPISRQFVHLLGGELKVTSEPGRGSTFYFEIPVMLVEAAAVNTKQVERRAIAPAANQPTYRILVVEDNQVNQQLLRDLLQPFGFAVQAVDNGLAALARWQSWHPHLIWMDIRMPGMDGCEVTRQIRAQEALRTEPSAMGDTLQLMDSQVPIPTKIIALSASAFANDRKIALAAGCDDFVAKPFQESLILEKLSEHLGVQYVYEQQRLSDQVQTAVSSSPLMLEPATFQVMPREWLAQFYDVVTQLNRRKMLAFVAQIPAEHRDLEQALKEKINNFDFEQLMELIQQAIQQTELTASPIPVNHGSATETP